jgi:hypothetical protein
MQIQCPRGMSHELSSAQIRGNVGSNTAGGIDVCVYVVLCVGRGCFLVQNVLLILCRIKKPKAQKNGLYSHNNNKINSMV